VWRTGRLSATTHGVGNRLCLGKWGQVVPVSDGRFYRVRVVFRHQHLEDVNLNLLIALAWRVADRPTPPLRTDRLSRFGVMPDGWMHGEGVIRAPQGCIALELELCLRLTANGTVWWDGAEVTEVPPQLPRPVKLASVRWCPEGPSTLERNLAELSEALDVAGQQGWTSSAWLRC